MPSYQPPAPRARFCDTSRAEWGVWGLGGWGVGGWGLLARCRGFCAMLLGGLRAVTTLTAFWHSLGRKRGPGVILVGGCASFECGIVTPYGGFVCSPMLDND